MFADSNVNAVTLAMAVIAHNRRFGQYGDAFSDDMLETLADTFKASNPSFDCNQWFNYIQTESQKIRDSAAPQRRTIMGQEQELNPKGFWVNV